MQKNLTKAVVATGALAVALTMAAAPSKAVVKSKMVKCYGVAAKGKNDCETKVHSCAGQAKADNMPDEWVLAPANVCKKLAKAGVGAPRK